MTIEKTIVFKKAILEKLNAADGEWRYAKNIEYLYIRVFENKKTYYASWSIPVLGEDGRIRSIGKKKKLGGFHIPLEEIKVKCWAVLIVQLAWFMHWKIFFVI